MLDRSDLSLRTWVIPQENSPRLVIRYRGRIVSVNLTINHKVFSSFKSSSSSSLFTDAIQIQSVDSVLLGDKKQSSRARPKWQVGPWSMAHVVSGSLPLAKRYRLHGPGAQSQSFDLFRLSFFFPLFVYSPTLSPDFSPFGRYNALGPPL